MAQALADNPKQRSPAGDVAQRLGLYITNPDPQSEAANLFCDSSRDIKPRKTAYQNMRPASPGASRSPSETEHDHFVKAKSFAASKFYSNVKVERLHSASTSTSSSSSSESDEMNSELVRGMAGGLRPLEELRKEAKSGFSETGKSKYSGPPFTSPAQEHPHCQNGAQGRPREESYGGRRPTVEDLWEREKMLHNKAEEKDNPRERYFKLCHDERKPDMRLQDNLCEEERAYFRGFMLDDELLERASGAIALGRMMDNTTKNRVALLARQTPEFRAKVMVVANAMALDVVRAQQRIIAQQARSVIGLPQAGFAEGLDSFDDAFADLDVDDHDEWMAELEKIGAEQTNKTHAKEKQHDTDPDRLLK